MNLQFTIFPNICRNKNKSRRRKKPGGQSVFKKHENQPYHERNKKPDEIGEPLPFTEIEGPLIPILKSGNIEQARASLLATFVTSSFSCDFVFKTCHFVDAFNNMHVNHRTLDALKMKATFESKFVILN